MSARDRENEIRIIGATDNRLHALRLAVILLEGMKQMTVGAGSEPWMCLDEENCHAVMALEKMNAIEVIKFNDGKNYGRVKL